MDNAPDIEYATAQGVLAGTAQRQGKPDKASEILRHFRVWKALQPHCDRYRLQVAYNQGVEKGYTPKEQ